MACLQIYREQLSLTTYLRLHSDSKVSILTCHIKPKFFIGTKHLENLLLTKYLISYITISISKMLQLI